MPTVAVLQWPLHVGLRHSIAANSVRWDWAVITSRSGRSGFEGYEAVDLIRRYPATARRSALLR